MSAAVWRRVEREGLPALAAFLRDREPVSVGFTGRLLRDGRLHLPNPLTGVVYASCDPDSGPEGKPGGALLFVSSRIAFPLLPEMGEPGGDAASDFSLAKLLADRNLSPVSIVGLRRHVERLEAAMGLWPIVPVAYRLMSRPFVSIDAVASFAGAQKGAGIGGAEAGDVTAPPGGLAVGRAGPEDLEGLYPLQEIYEKEEVLTAIHRFEPAACRAALARSLRDQIVVSASLDGFPVGKAGTNARAYAFDQIGGVCVAPPYRRRGIGRALMERLLGILGAEGRGASLFVKTRNAPAQGLYESLGFVGIDDYRADYFAS